MISITNDKLVDPNISLKNYMRLLFYRIRSIKYESVYQNKQNSIAKNGFIEDLTLKNEIFLLIIGEKF